MDHLLHDLPLLAVDAGEVDERDDEVAHQYVVLQLALQVVRDDGDHALVDQRRRQLQRLGHEPKGTRAVKQYPGDTFE